ncbi:MAG: PHB depolymerase family esterase [Colwellia sp.]|nr:PHB depolymerase family esterase [Colwellia sp.]MCW8864184.1 PHB depolymerase family esterase [Colwellia sp.]MCW9083182.1 PHB depolymerase family esterase [Colwellia sp.]
MVIIQHLKIPFLAMTLILFSQHSFAEFTVLEAFGDNPGSLEASYFTPQAKSPALVVLLHGCAQNGEQLAQQTGLLGLAKKHQFALLLPQQALSNNIKRCFNWYSTDDYSRDKGESLSLKNMIATVKQQFSSDKVYIVGLSAGGAMTSNMLVNYPELFTAGAVIAGIPFPCADGLITGISCMKNGPSQTSDELVSQIEKITSNQIAWPRLSVWTGVEDSIVNPLNASMLAQQWAQLSKITAKPTVTHKSGYQVTRWQNVAKETQVELIEVAKLGHGIMVNPRVANGGEASDYLLAAPVSTAKYLVDFWHLQREQTKNIQ